MNEKVADKNSAPQSDWSVLDDVALELYKVKSVARSNRVPQVNAEEAYAEAEIFMAEQRRIAAGGEFRQEKVILVAPLVEVEVHDDNGEVVYGENGQKLMQTVRADIGSFAGGLKVDAPMNQAHVKGCLLKGVPLDHRFKDIAARFADEMNKDSKRKGEKIVPKFGPEPQKV
jgi:hypothetical protein